MACLKALESRGCKDRHGAIGAVLTCIVCAQHESAWLDAVCTPALIDSACTPIAALPTMSISGSTARATTPLVKRPSCTPSTECRWEILPQVALHPFIDAQSAGLPFYTPFKDPMISALDCMRMCLRNSRCCGYTFKVAEGANHNYCWLISHDGGAHLTKEGFTSAVCHKLVNKNCDKSTHQPLTSLPPVSTVDLVESDPVESDIAIRSTTPSHVPPKYSGSPRIEHSVSEQPALPAALRSANGAVPDQGMDSTDGLIVLVGTTPADGSAAAKPAKARASGAGGPLELETSHEASWSKREEAGRRPTDLVESDVWHVRGNIRAGYRPSVLTGEAEAQLAGVYGSALADTDRGWVDVESAHASPSRSSGSKPEERQVMVPDAHTPSSGAGEEISWEVLRSQLSSWALSMAFTPGGEFAEWPWRVLAALSALSLVALGLGLLIERKLRRAAPGGADHMAGDTWSNRADATADSTLRRPGCKLRRVMSSLVQHHHRYGGEVESHLAESLDWIRLGV